MLVLILNCGLYTYKLDDEIIDINEKSAFNGADNFQLDGQEGFYLYFSTS